MMYKNEMVLMFVQNYLNEQDYPMRRISLHGCKFVLKRLNGMQAYKKAGYIIWWQRNAQSGNDLGPEPF